MPKLSKPSTSFSDFNIEQVRKELSSDYKETQDAAKIELILRSPYFNDGECDVQKEEALALAEEFVASNENDIYRSLCCLVLVVENIENNLLAAARNLKKAFVIARAPDTSHNIIFQGDLRNLALMLGKNFLDVQKDELNAAVWLGLAMFLGAGMAEKWLLNDLFFPKANDDAKANKQLALNVCLFSILLCSLYKTNWFHSRPPEMKKYWNAYNYLPNYWKKSRIFKTLEEKKLTNFWGYADDTPWSILLRASDCDPKTCLEFFKIFFHFEIITLTEQEEIIQNIIRANSMIGKNPVNKELEDEGHCLLATLTFESDTPKAFSYLNRITNLDEKYKTVMELALRNDKTYIHALSLYQELKMDFVSIMTRIFPNPEEYLLMTTDLIHAAKVTESPLLFEIFNYFMKLKEHATEHYRQAKEKNLPTEEGSMVHLNSNVDRLYVEYALSSCYFLFKHYENGRSATTFLADPLRFLGIKMGNLIYSEDEKIKNILENLRIILNKFELRDIAGKQTFTSDQIVEEFISAIQDADRQLLADDDEKTSVTRRGFFVRILEILVQVQPDAANSQENEQEVNRQLGK